MLAIKQRPESFEYPQPVWTEAQIASDLGNGVYQLDDGSFVQQAVSCLVTPAAGDRVLASSCADGSTYIVHILSRSVSSEACLSVPGASGLAIRQTRIDIAASEQISLRSLRDIEVTASTGVLTLNARNLFTTVSESLVENIRHYVSHVGQYLLEVKSLMRLHSRQALITAEQDIKVDAERITMG